MCGLGMRCGVGVCVCFGGFSLSFDFAGWWVSFLGFTDFVVGLSALWFAVFGWVILLCEVTIT